MTLYSIWLTLHFLIASGCGDKHLRTTSIDPIVNKAVISADSVEVFVVDGAMAFNYDKGFIEKPGSGFVDLLGEHYATEYLGCMDEETRQDVEELILNPRNYSTSILACDFCPGYGLRYCSSEDPVTVLICQSCTVISIQDETGNRLDGGNILPSQNKWSQVIEKLLESR
ncbi:MAG: hypothetical protein ABIF77_02795 [bacterium]